VSEREPRHRHAYPDDDVGVFTPTYGCRWFQKSH